MSNLHEFPEGAANLGDLGGRAGRGALVMIVARAATEGIRILGTVVLARLVSPEEWGLVAIVIALTNFGPMLIDLGLGDAAVQKRAITHAEVNGLFWVNLGLAVAVALLLVLASPFIASLYGQPRLAGIAVAIGITFVLNSLSLQHVALLKRTLRFNDISAINIAAAAGGSAVGIALALLGAGYWALVGRSMATTLMTAAGAWLRSDWRPSAPQFDKAVLPLVKFGMHITGGAVAITIATGLDRAALGLLYVPQLVGFYQNGLMAVDNATAALAGPLNHVGVAALSRLNGNAALLREKYAAALTNVCFYSMPAFATLAVVGSELVPLLFGDRWGPAGLIVQIFALRGILHVVESSQTWLHVPIGRPDRQFRWAILTAVVQGTAILAGLPFGIAGVAGGIALARSALAIPAVIYAGRPINLRPREILGAVTKQFSGAIVAFFAGMAVMQLMPDAMNSIGRISMAASGCLATYVLLVVGLFRLRSPLGSASSLTKGFLPERFRPGWTGR